MYIYIQITKAPKKAKTMIKRATVCMFTGAVARTAGPKWCSPCAGKEKRFQVVGCVTSLVERGMVTRIANHTRTQKKEKKLISVLPEMRK